MNAATPLRARLKAARKALGLSARGGSTLRAT
jgi:hypothetical protein